MRLRVAVALLFALVTAWGQAPQWGYSPFGYISRLETVAVYPGNSNATLKISVLDKPGRGLPLSFPLIYNSTPYTKNAAGTAFVPNADFPNGWQVGPFFGSVHFDSHSVSEKDGNGYCLWGYDNNFRYYDSSGTLHAFPNAYLSSNGQTTYPLPRGTCHSGTLSTSQAAPDGSGFTLSASASGGIYAGVDVTAETVTDLRGDTLNGIAYSGQPLFEDTNGNYVSFSNPVSGETDWTDTTGTVVVKDIVESSGCTNPVNGQAYPKCEEIEVAEPGGSGYATYLLVEESANVGTGAACSGIADYSGTMTLPVFLVLPEYTSGSRWYYQFGYDSAGRMNSATFPGGGVTTFSYGSLCTFGDGSVSTLAVTENDGQGHAGTTTYTRNSASQTTIARPDSSKTVIAYDANGLPTDVKSYDTDASTLLKEVAYTNTTGTPEFPATAVTYLNGVKVAERDTSFDPQGDLTGKTDIGWVRDPTVGTKRTTSITYYSPGHPSQITVQDGAGATVAETTITYDNYAAPSGLVASTGAANHDAKYSATYTARGNPTVISRFLNATTSLTTYLAYEDTGNVVAVQDANGNRLATSYGNCADSYPSSQSVAGGTETLTFECARGLTTAVTDPNSATTSFGFDAEGRLTSTSNPDGGGVSSITYTSPSETDTNTKISASQNLVEHSISDGFGRTTYGQTQAPSGCDTVETVYDSMGRAASVSTPYNTTCGAPAAATLFTSSTFDGLGRVLKTTAPDGSATSYSYNSSASEITGPAGVKKILEADGWGALWQVCEVSGQAGSGNCSLAIAGSGYLTQYGYNPLGEITSVNEAGQARSFVFDWLGRMTSETNPESGTTNYTFDAATDSTCSGGSSSSAGDLVLMADAAGGKVCLKYDAWHRLTDRHLSNGDDYAYTWDGSAASHSLGRLVSATAPATTDTFVYDSMGRPTTITEAPSGLGTQTVSYTYNYFGAPLTEAAPSRTWGYQYDVEGRVTGMYDTADNWFFFGNRNYNPAGQLLSQTLAPSNNPADGSVDFSYNNDGQPWQFTYNTWSATNALQYQWGATIDANGNATSSDDNGTLRKLIFPNNTGWTLTFGHDDLGRVSSAATADNAINVTEGYDAYGNRNTQSGTLSESFTASATTNQVSGFGYDAAGRVTSGSWGSAGARTIGWDPAGQLTSYSDGSESATYKYDPFGRRVEMTVNGATTYYLYGASDGGHPIAEDIGGVWYREAIMDGVRWGSLQQNGDGRYTLPDALGSTAVFGHDGTVEPSRFYPFGEEAQATSAEYKWTNQIRDANALDQFAFRTYSSNLGRWLSPDPAGLAAVDPADPSSWNRYSYVENQPLSAVDPLGLFDSGLSAAALYTESQAMDSSRNFGAGWDEFDVMSIPVLVEGQQTVFEYKGKTFTMSPGGEGGWGWHYTNDANGEALYNLASLNQEMRLPFGPILMDTSLFQALTSPKAVTEVANIRSALAKRGRPVLQAHLPPPPRVAPTPSPYSRNWWAQQGCEWGHALSKGNVGVTTLTNIAPIYYILTGNYPRAAVALGVMAGWDVGGAFSIRERCVQAVYGPGAF